MPGHDFATGSWVQVSTFSSIELRGALSLAAVISLRLFGIFLILPVFALYARHMPDATPLLIGVGLGIYGIGQMLLQIPLGMLSDRIGRKPAITIGLLVFAAGGLVAALAHTIIGVIVGRAVQGMGAVSGSGTALAADLSHETNRGKVLGIIGASIGLSFLLALILGPILEPIGGLNGLFGITSILALISLLLLWALVPNPQQRRSPAAAGYGKVLEMLRDSRLLVLNGSVFFLHAMLTAVFVALPLLMSDNFHIAAHRQWELYLPVMIVAALVMGGVLRRMHAIAQALRVTLVCVVALGLSLLGLAFSSGSVAALGVAAAVFFSAFNLLEAALPSLVTRVAPDASRGAAMGAFSTSQFAGALVGGVLGGKMLGMLGVEGVFIAAAVPTLVWAPLILWGARKVRLAEQSTVAAAA